MESTYIVRIANEGDERALTATDVRNAIDAYVEHMIDDGDMSKDVYSSLSISVEAMRS